MIKPSFLKGQASKSSARRQTTPFLRRLILSTVDGVARDHYRDAYARKCLQTSAAIQMLLRRFDIDSTQWIGAACFAEVFEGCTQAAWGGFWRDVHHVWLVSEFDELVDLSITRKHEHSECRRPDGIPIPAIWWDDIAHWPSLIRYLPDSIVQIGLPDPEAVEDLRLFKAKVAERFDEVLKTATVEDIGFGSIVSNVAVMNALLAQGHPWLVKAIAFQKRAIPFPQWIVDREAEIVRARQSGATVPSRLFPTPNAAHDNVIFR